MKKILFITAMLLVGCLQQSNAQQRRNRTVRRTNVTRNTTTTQQQKKPVQRVIKEVAFYDIKVNDVALYDNKLYCLESSENNALLAVDCNSGEVTTIIPGQANVYEGRRPYYSRMKIAGGRLMLKHGDQYLWSVSDNQGGWIKKEWEKVVATNDRYALIELQSSDIEIWDMKEMRMMGHYSEGAPQVSNRAFVIDSNGSIWWPYAQDKIGIMRMTTDGKKAFANLSDQAYVSSENIKKISWMARIGDWLYVSCRRRIYRMNMVNPTPWEEYAKVSPTVDYSFDGFWPNRKGDLLTYCDNGWQGNMQFYRASDFNNPQALGKGKYIDTGFDKFNFSDIRLSIRTGEKVLVDNNNNYIITNGYPIAIYNPDGIIGYENARGKIIKP